MQGAINALQAVVDFPDVIEYINDITIASGGARAPLTETFRSIKNVLVTLQDNGAGASKILVLDKNATLGPLLKASNAAGADVSALLDLQIQGY